MVEVVFRRKVSRLGQASLYVNIPIEILEHFNIQQGDYCGIQITEKGMNVRFSEAEENED